MTRQRDVGIYLVDCPLQRALAWAGASLACSLADPFEDAGILTYQVPDGALIVFEIEPGVLDVWFNTATRPWDTSIACARAAATELDCTVMVDPGPEHPAPDDWLQVTPAGEKRVTWPDADC